MNYNKGYNAAIDCIKEGQDSQDLLNQMKTSLTEDAFDRGWKDACIKHGATE